MNAKLHFSTPVPHVALLAIDHPPANSLSASMKLQFGQMLDKVEASLEIRVLIIGGKGKKFCSGDDLKEAIQNSKTEGAILKNLRNFTALMNRIENLPIPVIAAINGWAIGGGLELALCCDIRLASTSANFATAGVSVGLIASANRLPRIIGLGPAKHLLLSGDPIGVETAMQYGLITGYYKPSALLPAAIALAQSIASKAPLAVKAAKKVANMAIDTSLSESQFIQQETLEHLAQTQDYQEALLAFSEKRPPEFKGI